MRTVRFLLFVTLALAVLVVTSAPTGASSPATTERVSVDSVGIEGNDDSGGPTLDVASLAISADGRYVAFVSRATNLVDGDTNTCFASVPGGCPDVFVRDRQTGTTERVSVDSAGNQGNDQSGWPAISAEGRYVAYSSDASNLVPEDTNDVRDVFVRDRQTGSTERVSVDSAGNQGSGHSADPAISGDGRYVAFESLASNLVAGDTNGVFDVFVHDRQTGVTQRVSVDSAGNQGSGQSRNAAISGDGRYVAFESLASNLVPGDTNGVYDGFLHDRQTGTTERVSVDSAGNQGSAHSLDPAISADGRYVAFDSVSSLAPGDTNGVYDVFLHDRQTETTERISVDSGGNQANNGSGPAAVGGDGRYVAFESRASNLVAGDTNGSYDVFLHDRQTGATERVSVDSEGNEGGGRSELPAMTANGRYVGFQSAASNLVPYDTNGRWDVFVHDVGDADGDGEWDAFDPCPANPDCDSDSFSDGVERYLATDPLDACPDDPSDDAWPLDPNMDCQVSIVGDVLNFRDRIGATPGAPNWWQRLDFNGDGQLSVVGDLLMYMNRIGETCE